MTGIHMHRNRILAVIAIGTVVICIAPPSSASRPSASP